MERINRRLYTSVRNYAQMQKAVGVLKAKGLPAPPLPRRRVDNKWDIKLKNFFIDEVYHKGMQGLPQRIDFEIIDTPTSQQFYEMVLEYYSQKTPFYEADLRGDLATNAHAGIYSDGSVFKKALVEYGAKNPGKDDRSFEIPARIRKAIAAQPPSSRVTRSTKNHTPPSSQDTLKRIQRRVGSDEVDTQTKVREWLKTYSQGHPERNNADNDSTRYSAIWRRGLQPT